MEVIEEDLEETVLRAHLAKEDLPVGESYDLLSHVEWYGVTVSCSPLSSHRSRGPHFPPRSSPALSRDHHHRPFCASYSSSAPSLPSIGSPVWSMKGSAPEILRIYSSL